MTKSLTVTMTIDQRDLYDIAQYAIDVLEEDFGCEVLEAAGVDEVELIQAIVEDKTFQSMIIDAVKEDGFDVIQNPYDYMDGYDLVSVIPGLTRIAELCQAMDDIILEATKEPEVTCVPVPAGYKLVKI
jgi:23S rRNA U2552 (ribose-2'-O)-methylase RlmE/FtsJ